MRLRSRKLEKAIRGLARDRIRSSPELLGEFNRHRKSWLVKLACAIPLCVGLAFVPLLFLSALLQPGGNLPGEQNGAELSLVAVGLVGFGFFLSTFGMGSRSDPQGFGELVIYVANHFPVRDSDLIARNRKHWAMIAFFSVTLCMWLNCYWCVLSNRPVAWGYAAALGVALLQGALATAIGRTLLNLPDKPLKGLLAFLGFVIFAAGFVITWIAVRREDMFDSVTRATFLLCPLGWAHGAFYWGVIQGHAAAYLLLVPPVAMFWGLVCWIRRETWPNDFFFDADTLAQAATPREDDRRRRFRENVAQPSRPEPRSTEAIEQQLLQGDWLRGDVWTPRGPVDRFALRALNPREKLLIECLYGRGSILTWQCGAMLVGLLVSAGLVLVNLPLEQGLTFVPILMVGCWGFASGIGVPPQTRYLVLTPIGFREVSKTMFKLGLIKCLCWAPLTVGFCLSIAALHGVSPLSAIELGLLPVIVYFGWLPMGVCLWFDSKIGRTTRRPMRILELTCGIFACMATLLILLPSGDWRVFLLPAGVWPIFLAPWGVCRVFLAAVLFVSVGTIWACTARTFRGPRVRRSP